MAHDLRKQEFKKRLYLLVLSVIKMTDKLDRKISNEVITRQLIRSVTSILANYIEAEAASSKKDYINFFHHSLKSANESKVWLQLIKDTNKDLPEIDKYLCELDEISKIFASSVLTMKKK